MSYFVRKQTACCNKYNQGVILKMLDFLIFNVFVESGGRVFQQTDDIPMGPNCAPLLADLFFTRIKQNSFRDSSERAKRNKWDRLIWLFAISMMFRHWKNPKFSEHLDQIYPSELEIKEPTDSTKSASYFDLFLEID